MRVLLLLLLATITASSKKVPTPILVSWDELTREFRDECVKHTGVDPVLAYRVFLYQEFVDDPYLKCYLRCLCRNVGLLDENDKAILDVWVEKVAGVTTEIGSRCIETTQNYTDSCEKSYGIGLCIVESVGK